MTRTASRLSFLLPLLLAAAPAAAKSRLASLPSARQSTVFSSGPSSATLTCDHLEYLSAEGVLVATGNVVMVSSGTRLEADSLKLNLSSHTAEGRGRIRVQEDGLTLLADGVDFDWSLSSGVFHHGYIEDPPYRIWARRIVRVSSELYHMEHAAVTSCDNDPPHYHVRMAHMDYRPDKSAAAWWPRFALGEDTLMGFPYYSKSLGTKKSWTFTVDPGRSDYHGYFFKSILGYRVGDTGVARLYWDHYTRTGEGTGAEYTYHSPTVRGSVYGYRIEDRVAGSNRWNARAAHWQQLSPRLSLEVNALAQSDADFNNLYFKDDPFRVVTGAQSSAAMSYQHPNFTSRVTVEQDQVFDPFRGKFVRSRTLLPQVSFQGVPWKVARDTYFTLAGTARNEYDRPTALPPLPNPIIPDKDRFRPSGDGSMNLQRKISLGRNATLEPSAGVSGTWESWRDLGATRDPHDLIQGRAFTGLNLRHRLTRNLDYDLTHTYTVRWSPNQLQRDHAAADQGLEANLLSLVTNYRLDKASARLSSGYDLRQADGETLQTPRRKITPPALDLSWRPSRRTSLSYREVYGLYPARHPESTEFSVRTGKTPDLQFTSGFSYNAGFPGQLQLRHGAAFQLTPGWHVDANLRYVVQDQDGGLHYKSLPKERLEQEFIITRDLHCWTSRITFRRRPGLSEAFVRIELKTSAAARRLQEMPDEQQYYPGRGQGGER